MSYHVSVKEIRHTQKSKIEKMSETMIIHELPGAMRSNALAPTLIYLYHQTPLPDVNALLHRSLKDIYNASSIHRYSHGTRRLQ